VTGDSERSACYTGDTTPTAGTNLDRMTDAPPAGFLCLIVGYDGSPPANRALDAATRLLQGRVGRIDVVYVAHLSSLVMMSPGAIAEMESDFDEIEQELRAAAAEQLRPSGAVWEFERRQGIVADELIVASTAIRDAHADQTVVIVVGSSSHVGHRMVGSVAVSLARHSPVPLVIVP
jgi:nucleotide-binding universal stress UspA family protein